MLRVLVVETTAFGYDGITNVIINYYKYQDHTKVHMDIVTINQVTPSFRALLDQYGSKNIVLPYRNTNPLKYINALRKILAKGNYSIVHVHGCSATMTVEMLAAKFAGVKVRIAHSHNTTCDHARVDKMLRPLFNKWCNVGFACGKEAGEWLFPKKNFTVVYNGIDLDRFQFNQSIRDEFRKKYHLENKLVIGHVGRFSEQKNHRKLIDIFTEYSRHNTNAKLVLVGDGELKSDIENLSRNTNLNVLFVGLSDEVEKWLQAFDIVVFPSLFEGLPLGLVEAQATCLPCVVSDAVPLGINITNLVSFVSLDASASVWCKQIEDSLLGIDRASMCRVVKMDISAAHFDIRNNCADLYDKYKRLLDDSVYD